MKLIWIAICVAVLALAGGATAQARRGDMVVNVPFAFFVADQKLPAGHYIVAQEFSTIRVYNEHTMGVYVPTHAAVRAKAKGSKLVFHRYRDSYFLSAVWITGSTNGKELYPSRAEREVKARQAEMELAVLRPAR